MVVVSEVALITFFVVALTVAPLYQHATAATATSVTASGTGTHKCPTAQTAKSSSLSFTAKGPLTLAGATAITGALSAPTGNLLSYTAKGVVQFNLCPGGLPGGEVTISGTCGSGQIKFKSNTIRARNAGSGLYTGFSICR